MPCSLRTQFAARLHNELALSIMAVPAPPCRDVTGDWPRGSCGPHHASKEAEKAGQTVCFPGVTKAELLESCCLLLINEDHPTNRKRNPKVRLKPYINGFASCNETAFSNSSKPAGKMVLFFTVYVKMLRECSDGQNHCYSSVKDHRIK